MSAKQDIRSLSEDAQVLLRQKAVELVKGGKKQVEAAEILGIHRNTVGQWVRKFRKGGPKPLALKPRGGRKKRHLNKLQENWVRKQIEDKHPEQLKLPFVLWTREAVQALIEKRYRFKMPLRTITDYLKRWEMTPQKPIIRAYQQDPQAVEKWKKEVYPKIVAKAKRENGLIYWLDESGLRSVHAAGRSFSPRGTTPIVPGTGNRFSSNMISAVNNRGQMAFSVFDERFTVPVFLNFLKRLLKHAKGRKPFVILDGHPVHKAKSVEVWLEKLGNKMELFPLPGYSPELNPDELLNQDLKATVFKRKRPRNKTELKAQLRSRLYAIQKQPHRIKSYFQHPDTLYAAL